MGTMVTEVTLDGTPASETPDTLAELTNRCVQLMKECTAGNPQSVEALHAFVQQHPGVYGHMTDLKTWLRLSWVEAMVGVGQSDAVDEGVKRQMEAYAADLMGPDPSGITRRLADLAALHWLELQVLSRRASSSESSFAGSEVGRRALDSASSRLQKTLKVVASVRRLERGLEIHVSHENVSGTSQRPSAKVVTTEEREIAAVESECCRQPRVADRLRGLVPEEVA